MGNMETAYETLAVAVIICIALLIVACLIRSVIGPRVTDRIVAVNSIGTMTIVIIAVLVIICVISLFQKCCINGGRVRTIRPAAV